MLVFITDRFFLPFPPCTPSFSRIGYSPMVQVYRGCVTSCAASLTGSTRAAGLRAPVSGAKFVSKVLERVQPRPLVFECIQSLRQQGYKTAVLTNNFKCVWPCVVAAAV